MQTFELNRGDHFVIYGCGELGRQAADVILHRGGVYII